MSSVDLGCGERKRGEIGVDFRRIDGVDILADVSALPFKDESFDRAIASDILEHFPRAQTLDVLREWRRILREGGHLQIKAPNLHRLARAYLMNAIETQEFARKIYGNQGNEGDYHKTGFDPKTLEDYLMSVGFVIVDIHEIASEITEELGDWSNLLVTVRRT